MHAHIIIILLSCVVILSYLFNVFSRKTNIPAVLLLIAVGVGLKYAAGYMGYAQFDVSALVKILGAVGLIMIILEAALDLEVNKGKVRLIRDSFLSAGVVFIVSLFGIGYIISYWLGEPLRLALIYAVPMSIISSAIVIPSTAHLPEHKKEFIIYESSFSDIIGILGFNYLVMDNIMSWQAVGIFGGNVLLAIALSVTASFILLYVLATITSELKFFLLFAVLALVYALGESIHLPSLLTILVFGLVLNNYGLFLRGMFRKMATDVHMDTVLMLLRSITAETSFLIRTFFFILFGYSINIALLGNPQVIALGSAIVGLLLLVRFIYLRLILKANLFPELFLMPRGLVTILLFYSIPASKTMNSFNIGVLFFVVVASSLLMMVGLMAFKKEVPEAESEVAEIREEVS